MSDTTINTYKLANKKNLRQSFSSSICIVFIRNCLYTYTFYVFSLQLSYYCVRIVTQCAQLFRTVHGVCRNRNRSLRQTVVGVAAAVAAVVAAAAAGCNSWDTDPADRERTVEPVVDVAAAEVVAADSSS